MTFFRTEELPAKEMAPGIIGRNVYLEGVMLNFVDLAPRSTIPDHHHPHQQISFIISGRVEFAVGGKKRLLEAGDGVLIPPNQPHSAVTFEEPCRLVDAFHPIREDYV